MEEFESRYLEVMVNPEHVAAARALKPIQERSVFGRSVMLFDGANREQVAALGEVRRPSIADLFVAGLRRGEGGYLFTGIFFKEEREIPGGHAPLGPVFVAS